MLSSLDDEFGEDLGLSLDDVPGLVDFTLRHPYTLFFSVKHQPRFEDRWPSKVVLFRSFVFRPEYLRMASLVLSRAKELFAEKENKMRKKETKMRKKERQRKSQTTFVGIHNRRGDHIQYQKEVKYYPLSLMYIVNVFFTWKAVCKCLPKLSLFSSMSWWFSAWLPPLYVLNWPVYANMQRSNFTVSWFRRD